MTNDQPKISIITVVFNAVRFLEGTIQSVLSQSYPNIEYIVIDGASTDGTVEMIKKYQDRISCWVSEADEGLYDAMNKGLKLANGDYVWFLNAGDRVFDAKTVGKLLACAKPETDVLFGEVMLVDEERCYLGTRSELTTQKLPKSLTWKSLRLGMVVCHQGFIVRKAIAPRYRKGNLAADIDWVIECLKRSKNVVNTHLLFAEYLQGGISKMQHQKSLTDRYLVLKNHYGWLPNLFHHFLILCRALWVKISRIGKESY